MRKAILLFVSLAGMALFLSGCHYDWTLRRELLNIWDEDQNLRKEWQEVWQKYGQGSSQVDSIVRVVRIKDSLHVVRVTAILDERGWVGKDLVGTQGNNCLFIVIQHSDLKTMEKYLPMMRKAVREGNTEAQWLALLEDRVALGEGRKQTYGSQLYWDKKKNRSFVAPLADPDSVDVRRKSVGLNTMAEYLEQWKLTWDAETYKKELPELEKINPLE